MKNYIDMHIHTRASDGLFSPQEVIKKAKASKLKYISLTDHESVNGFLEIKEDESLKKLVLIPGLELHTEYQDREVHLLAYNFDYKDSVFLKDLKKLREKRTEVSYYTLENIKKEGFDVSWEELKKDIGSDIAITKGHIIQYLMKKYKKIDRNLYFDYFNPEGEKYLKFKGNNLKKSIINILDLGGIPVLAHPGLINDDKLVEEIVSDFPIGLEVYYYYYYDKEALIKKYYELAKNYGLIMTGGTDFHGYLKEIKLGDVCVPLDVIKKFI